MADDKKKTGKPDRDRVAAGEPYEVDDLAKKIGVPKATAEKAIKKNGPMRKPVEEALRRGKRGG